MKTNFGYARVIQVLLDIIYTSEPSGCQNIALAYQVIDLATHWQCETVLKILKKDLAIQALINNPDGPCNDQFRLAHRLGDYHLMALMVMPTDTMLIDYMTGPLLDSLASLVSSHQCTNWED
jgi:hypothetical protein